MADRLVHLERELLGVEDDGRHAGRTLVRAQEGRRLLAHPRRLALEAERVEVLPARLSARATVSARIAPDLENAVAGSERVDPAAALDELLLDVASLRGDEELVLALGPHERLGHLDVGVRERLLGAEAVVDLLREADGEGVARERRAVDAALRRQGSQPPVVRPGRSASEPSRARRRAARSRVRESPVAGESPRPADEDPDADALGLDVAHVLDPPVLRRDVLAAAVHDARVCVGGPGRERRLHGHRAQIPHGRDLISLGIDSSTRK